MQLIKRASKLKHKISRHNPLNGIHHISSIKPEDVVIVGFPKSGNTWAQTFMAALVHGVSSSDSVVQRLVPDIHYRKFFLRYNTPMYFKSHHLPKKQYRRVIYLLRDGRDAMVSYFYFLKKTGMNVTFKEMLEGNGLFPCRWHEHVEAWQKNPYYADMITVKYEDLLQNPVREFQRICDFCGLIRSEEALRRVAEETGFERMRERESASGWDDPYWPKDAPFVRKGKVGSWREEFPDDALEDFMKYSKETLVKHEYEAFAK